MKKHFQYLSYMLRHKWYVFNECRKQGIFWLGIIHDWSKFLPDEWIPYVDCFYKKSKKNIRDETGYYKPYDTGSSRFDFAWFLHQKRNKHHWQYWTFPKDDEGIKVFNMPIKYRKEMLADWIGAGKAKKSLDAKAWYNKNKDKIKLHYQTRDWIEDKI